MQDWNRDGHIDAALDFMAYNAIMGENSKPRAEQTTPKPTTGSGAGAAWAIVAAAIVGILIAIAR